MTVKELAFSLAVLNLLLFAMNNAYYYLLILNLMLNLLAPVFSNAGLLGADTGRVYKRITLLS